MKSISREDYLQEIYRLQQKRNTAIRMSELAQALGVSRPSVSEMIRNLRKDGEVRCSRYGKISLSEKGALEAHSLIRSHRLIERFLADILGLDDVHSEAHSIEHSVSGKFVDRIDTFMKQPDKCPDGYRIPRGDSRIVTLDKAATGKEICIVFSNISDADSFNRLKSLGIEPDTIVKIKKRINKGPVILEVHGSEIALGNDISRQILVEVAP